MAKKLDEDGLTTILEEDITGSTAEQRETLSAESSSYPVFLGDLRAFCGNSDQGGGLSPSTDL